MPRGRTWKKIVAKETLCASSKRLYQRGNVLKQLIYLHVLLFIHVYKNTFMLTLLRFSIGSVQNINKFNLFCSKEKSRMTQLCSFFLFTSKKHLKSAIFSFFLLNYIAQLLLITQKKNVTNNFDIFFFFFQKRSIHT